MTCCVYNMRTVLIVCATYWNVYDAGDFTCLLSVPCRRGERCKISQSGAFLALVRSIFNF